MKTIYKLLIFSFIGLFFSCEEDYTIVNPVTNITVIADSSVRMIGQNISFNAITNTGTNVTENVVFYVNGTAITGNIFTSATVGTFSVTAKYFDRQSEPISITFHDGSQTNFLKRVLIEDYTGTWCGWCVRVAYALEQVHNQDPTAVMVAIHRQQSTNPNGGGYDPYTFDSTALETILDDPGYPKGYLNRRTKWTSPEDQNIQQALTLTQGENPKVGLAMTSNITDNQINLDVKVKFAKNFSNLKLVVYVVENGLIFKQVNYTTYFNGPNTITNFEHNHVLKHCATNLLGDVIPTNETITGQVYTRNFSFAVPSNIANAANIEFVAFVVDENGNALNVRKAGKTETQTFEEI